MDIPDSIRRPTTADFEEEALRFVPNVARYARLLTRDAADADDLTQETFLRAYQSWNTFRPGTDCRKWLFTICRNIFLRDRQRASRFVALENPEGELTAMRQLYDSAFARGLSGMFDRIDLGPAIERGVRALQPEYRDAMLLVDVEDRSYAEAAAIVGVPIGTIRSRLFRARRLLQEALVEHARDRGLAVETNRETRLDPVGEAAPR
jgi:RNA polymerase sigma-70 factor (ECF subfamily)